MPSTTSSQPRVGSADATPCDQNRVRSPLNGDGRQSRAVNSHSRCQEYHVRRPARTVPCRRRSRSHWQGDESPVEAPPFGPVTHERLRCALGDGPVVLQLARERPIRLGGRPDARPGARGRPTPRVLGARTVRTDVDDPQEGHGLAVPLEAARQLEGQDPPVGVAGDEVRTGRLGPPHLGDVALDEGVDPTGRQRVTPQEGRLEAVQRLDVTKRLGEPLVPRCRAVQVVGHEQGRARRIAGLHLDQASRRATRIEAVPPRSSAALDSSAAWPPRARAPSTPPPPGRPHPPRPARDRRGRTRPPGGHGPPRGARAHLAIRRRRGPPAPPRREEHRVRTRP